MKKVKGPWTSLVAPYCSASLPPATIQPLTTEKYIARVACLIYQPQQLLPEVPDTGINETCGKPSHSFWIRSGAMANRDWISLMWGVS
jgi:hypothetical protein